MVLLEEYCIRVLLGELRVVGCYLLDGLLFVGSLNLLIRDIRDFIAVLPQTEQSLTTLMGIDNHQMTVGWVSPYLE